MIGVGVIGAGYWGPNLVRNFAETPDARVLAVSDLQPDRLARVQARYPGVRITTRCRDLLADPSVDAIVIATPISTHFDLAMQALEAGKHVLVEKPLAATVEQGQRLRDAADRCRRVLMVSHTFVYTGAVRKIRELVAGGQIGRLYYYDAVRVNLGLFQHDVNVLWDLAVHDLSIMDFVLAARPCEVAVTGLAHHPGRPENIAYLTCFFPTNLIAHLHVNWLAPVKVRRTLIGGDTRMIVYDDLEPDEKLRVYDKGVSFAPGVEEVHQLLVNYRTGDMWAPRLDRTEALYTEAVHFVECIKNGQAPVTDAAAGLRVLRVLEAADRSLASRGRPVPVGREG